ncbi:phosphoribosylglycinamide formyltransferase [Alkaliphilus sp. B6464]|uniref:phosphoribosylglycinamide formyltransferase n=1 Tax=Alkaliphilus sp. B6464 TaxID=2731219 RepID=UPI001BA69194|nr:phosphoribosylglycinamide formyltransferase [Alkaliphilus sp. B6464]QUH19934.1 phosphoribosylglycinamide formyltransferase [Alkaliphilus sp. B6464]
MKNIKIAVMISGGGTNLQSLIDEVHNKSVGGEIVLVVSNREDAYGLTRAKSNGIKSIVINRKQYKSDSEYEQNLVNTLEEAEVELIVLAGYLAFIPIEVIKKYENRIINIHPSLIPSFCGKGFYGEKVHQEAIRRGVKVTGATVHFVNEEMDGGPIIIQKDVNVDFNDTVESLQKKVLKVEHEILPLAVRLFIDDRLRITDNRVNIL